MTDKKLKISIVIATKNRLLDIIKCIESILIQKLLPDEIIIVDASDTQELKSEIEHRVGKKVKKIYIHTKPGTNFQRNIGVEASCGDIIFFLDDDVILDEEFVKEIVKVFKNDKEGKIGGVCGDITNIKNINNKNHSIMRSMLITIYKIMGRTLSNIFFLLKSGNGMFRLSGFSTQPYGTNKIVNVEFLPSGLTAFRREVLNEFSWDENLAGPSGYCYMDDDDFSYRVSRKYTNIYTPYAKVIHKSSPVARDKRYDVRKLLIKNHRYLFKKNFPQTIQHKFAFYMSIIGLFVLEIMCMMRTRNADGLRGLKDGLLDVEGKKGN